MARKEKKNEFVLKVQRNDKTEGEGPAFNLTVKLPVLGEPAVESFGFDKPKPPKPPEEDEANGDE